MASETSEEFSLKMNLHSRETILTSSNRIGIMLITAYVGVRRYHNSGSPLLLVFYQDGILYFISLAGEYDVWSVF